MDRGFCDPFGRRSGFSFVRIVVLAPNPGRIHAVFAVDLPFPRTAALRDTPEFGALVAQVSHILREAIRNEDNGS